MCKYEVDHQLAQVVQVETSQEFQKCILLLIDGSLTHIHCVCIVCVCVCLCKLVYACVC